MLTKKNLWFLTLFCIILVMSIYYIAMPNDNAGLVNRNVDSNGVKTEVTESNTISALRVSREESLENEVSAIKEILLDESKSTEEKSDAYEALKELNANKGKEESLEAIIKKDFNYENFVKIDGTNVKVVIEADKHSYDLANKVMKRVQNEFDAKVYVTVSFGTV